MRSRRCAGAALAGALTVFAVVPGASAQTWPSKPVRIVVGYTAGGPVDILARVFGPRLAETFGQQFPVDNRPGASGMIGTEAVAKASPDGHTLLMVSATHAINSTLYPNAPFDPERDFAPIAQVAGGPFVLVVHPSFPVKSVRDLIAVAKGKPGEIVYASSGTAGLPHLAGELFQSMAGVRMTHVPYKGAAPATVDIMAGQVPVMFNNMLSAMPHVKSGKLRPLAVTSGQRSPVLPDTPTIAESGLAGYEVTGWYGLLAPAGTSPEIVSRLNAECVRIAKLPAVTSRLSGEGIEPVGAPPEAFARLIATERVKWAQVIRRSGAKAD